MTVSVVIVQIFHERVNKLRFFTYLVVWNIFEVYWECCKIGLLFNRFRVLPKFTCSIKHSVKTCYVGVVFVLPFNGTKMSGCRVLAAWEHVGPVWCAYVNTWYYSWSVSERDS